MTEFFVQNLKLHKTDFFYILFTTIHEVRSIFQENKKKTFCKTNMIILNQHMTDIFLYNIHINKTPQNNYNNHNCHVNKKDISITTTYVKLQHNRRK